MCFPFIRPRTRAYGHCVSGCCNMGYELFYGSKIIAHLGRGLGVLDVVRQKDERTYVQHHLPPCKQTRATLLCDWSRLSFRPAVCFFKRRPCLPACRPRAPERIDVRVRCARMKMTNNDLHKVSCRTVLHLGLDGMCEYVLIVYIPCIQHPW